MTPTVSQKIVRWLLNLLLLSAVFFSATMAPGAEVTSADILRKKFGLWSLENSENLAKIKIAILDEGFGDFKPESKLLPPNTEVFETSNSSPSDKNRGLQLAQIIWSLLGKPKNNPQFFLVNVRDPAEFKDAVQFIIDNQIQIVLCGKVWELGNFDGTGVINQDVDRALDAGTLWINSAGDFGKSVYGGSVANELPYSEKKGFLSPKSLAGLKFVNQVDNNDVKITLSWTAFKDSQNLDVLVYSSSQKLVASSEEEAEFTPGSAKKLVLKSLDRGTYTIRVRANSENFSSKDRYRVSVRSEKAKSVDFVDHSDGREIFSPADHPRVLTVAEMGPQSSEGPTTDGRFKPETWVASSRISFSSGVSLSGSPAAAAIVASGVVGWLARNPKLSQADLIDYSKSLLSGAMSAQEWIALDRAPNYIQALAPPASVIYLHPNNHFIIATEQDPFSHPLVRSLGLYRLNYDDILVFSATDKIFRVVPKDLRYRIFRPWVEYIHLTKTQILGEWRLPAVLQNSSNRPEDHPRY